VLLEIGRRVGVDGQSIIGLEREGHRAVYSKLDGQPGTVLAAETTEESKAEVAVRTPVATP
jgi:hypothetical protein